MTTRDQFEANGFASIAQMLPVHECESITAMTVSIDADAAGTSCLLVEEWCQALAAGLRQHADIATLISTD